MTELIRLQHVLKLVPVTKGTIYNWMRDGKFPKQHNINGNAFWLKADVDQWLTDNTGAQ